MVTNNVNGKVYIGMTRDSLRRRRNNHRSRTANGRTPFGRALRKYEPTAFSWDVIDTFQTTVEGKDKERHWISITMSQCPTFGYNLTDGGDGGDTSMCFTDDTRRKMSVATKKSWEQNYEHRRSLVVGEKNPMYGRKHTEASNRLNRLHQPMLGKSENVAHTKSRIAAMMSSPRFLQLAHRKTEAIEKLKCGVLPHDVASYYDVDIKTVYRWKRNIK